MKKINSIKQLRPEKKRIQQHQRELENRILNNWDELKKSLRPVNIAKEAFASVIRNRTRENLNGESILKSTISFGAGLLAKNLADKAGKKLSTIFRKGNSS